MKNTIFKPVMAFFAILAVLSAVGCDRTANNGNLARDQNAAPPATNSNMATDSMLTDAACSETNINDKLDKVKDAIAKKIGKKSGLQKQIDSGLLKYSIEIGPGLPAVSLDMYLEGGVGGKDNFKDLVDIIGDFVKFSCTNRVVFVTKGTIKPVSTALPASIDEFQWFVCEDPLVPCPGGTCRQQCLMKETAAAPALANSNTNAKPAVNSNANLKAGNMNK